MTTEKDLAIERDDELMQRWFRAMRGACQSKHAAGRHDPDDLEVRRRATRKQQRASRQRNR